MNKLVLSCLLMAASQANAFIFEVPYYLTYMSPNTGSYYEERAKQIEPSIWTNSDMGYEEEGIIPAEAFEFRTFSDCLIQAEQVDHIFSKYGSGIVWAKCSIETPMVDK